MLSFSNEVDPFFFVAHIYFSNKNMDEKSVDAISLQEPLSLKVYVVGVSNHKGSGVGLVMVSPERIIIKKSLKLSSSATNNEAKYEALLVGMTMVQKMGGKQWRYSLI